jgi:hypothetical protein
MKLPMRRSAALAGLAAAFSAGLHLTLALRK